MDSNKFAVAENQELIHSVIQASGGIPTVIDWQNGGHLRLVPEGVWLQYVVGAIGGQRPATNMVWVLSPLCLPVEVLRSSLEHHLCLAAGYPECVLIGYEAPNGIALEDAVKYACPEIAAEWLLSHGRGEHFGYMLSNVLRVQQHLPIARTEPMLYAGLFYLARHWARRAAGAYAVELSYQTIRAGGMPEWCFGNVHFSQGVFDRAQTPSQTGPLQEILWRHIKGKTDPIGKHPDSLAANRKNRIGAKPFTSSHTFHGKELSVWTFPAVGDTAIALHGEPSGVVV